MSAPSAAELKAVSETLAAITPPGVRTGCRSIQAADLARLAPIESAAVERAVPKRRHEFATGRVLLRELLDREDPIPVGADRAPVLPAGFVGSLAHCAGIAVAVVARAGEVGALGIDVEPVTVLAQSVADVVLRPDEAGLDAHRAFTQKEAVYKAWSRLGGGMLEHHDVRLESTGPGAFTGLVLPAGACFEGRFAEVAGHWLSVVVAPIGAWRNHASLAQRG